jgi:2'-5' RNA ligase
VSYIPEPLGGYLNQLRSSLVAGCRLHSHVTLLPPRQLRADPAALIEELGKRVHALAPFEVTLGEVEIFETTRVIYLAIERGWGQIEDFHAKLGAGIFSFEEYYPFHPHMTLAQEISGTDFERTLDMAREAWDRCPYPRTFEVKVLTFVRNVDPNNWVTLSQHQLDPRMDGVSRLGTG